MRHLINAARYFLSLDTSEHVAKVHAWLCHADGSECDGGATCHADPDRERYYR